MSLAPKPRLEQAREIHRCAVVIDSHCDTTQRLMDPTFDLSQRHQSGHVDIPRLREGGVDAVFLAVFAAGPLPLGAGPPAARAQLRRIHETVRQHAEVLSLARSAADVGRAKSAGKIAVLPAIEGGYLLDDSLEVLREFHDAGATYLTLTHAFHTHWADSSGVHEALEPLHGGLTEFGREVVKELNRLGMMVDVSHASDETFWEVLETSKAPVFASHSSCRAVCPHRRNLSDEMIRAIAQSGGVVQINFAAGFVDSAFPLPDPKAMQAWLANLQVPPPKVTDHRTPLSLLVDHFDHALQLVGPKHVGLGSDFDGVPALPDGMQDCSMLPNLTAALLDRGYDEADLVMILGGNLLRLMDACERARLELAGASPQPAAPAHRSDTR
ncbi:MAG: dipeptidase [Planctomycetota bacterium]